jgi:hypothetical protein
MEQIGTTPLGSLTQTVQKGNSISLLEGSGNAGRMRCRSFLLNLAGLI